MPTLYGRDPKIRKVGHVTSSRPVNRGLPVTPYLDSPTPICLFTIQLSRGTMTIKGSLQVSIATVKAFWHKIFKSRVWGKWGWNVKFCFQDSQIDMLVRNDVIWRTDRENRCRGLLCMASPEPKKTSRVTLLAGARGLPMTLYLNSLTPTCLFTIQLSLGYDDD